MRRAALPEAALGGATRSSCASTRYRETGSRRDPAGGFDGIAVTRHCPAAMTCFKYLSASGVCLSAYRNAGLSVQRAKLIDANALGGGRDYQFHPNGIRSLEIRSLGRLTQGVDAVLLLPGGRVGETRQLEHDP